MFVVDPGYAADPGYSRAPDSTAKPGSATKKLLRGTRMCDARGRYDPWDTWDLNKQANVPGLTGTPARVAEELASARVAEGLVSGLTEM
jgi:hypothetical protein